MEAGQFPILVPYFGVVAVSLGLAWYAWQNRQVAGAAPFAVYAVSQALVTAGYLLELVSPSLQAKHFWDDFQWIGASSGIIAVLLVALDFTNLLPAWKGRRIWPIMVVPTLFLLLVATNSLHGWVRAGGEIIPGEPFDALYYDFGLATWLFSVYIFGSLFFSVGLLGVYTFRVTGLYREQTISLLIGFLIPTVGILLTTYEIIRFGQRDIAPAFYIVGVLAVAWGLFRYGLFDLGPVARERVFEAISEAVLVLDSKHRVIDINLAGQNLFGIAEKDALGKDALPLFTGWPSLTAAYLRATAGLDHLDATLHEKDKSFQLHILALNSRERGLSGRLLVFNDITELVESRQEAERARDKALAADQLKSQFLASMSHELRTPLNAILNFNEMIALGMAGPVSEVQADLLNKSVASGHHLLNLINDVLDVSKIQAGMLTLFMEDDVNLAEEIRRVVDIAGPLVAAKPAVELIEDVDGNLSRLRADRRRIRQVMLNLVSNAVKFTDSGSVTISAKNRPGCVRLAVLDTGPGIAPEQQTAIFEPFVQTQTGLMHQAGTGLGLTISRSLVAAHGGRLWVESEPGEGAAFYVELPLMVAVATPPQSERE